TLAGRGGRRLLEMTNSLLDIAKFESGMMSLNCEPLDIGALFEDILAGLSNSARAAKVTISVSSEDNLPVLLADIELVRRTLNNLMDNALKFTPDAGHVILAARQDGDRLIRLRVTATG